MAWLQFGFLFIYLSVASPFSRRVYLKRTSKRARFLFASVLASLLKPPPKGNPPKRTHSFTVKEGNDHGSK